MNTAYLQRKMLQKARDIDFACHEGWLDQSGRQAVQERVVPHGALSPARLSAAEEVAVEMQPR